MMLKRFLLILAVCAVTGTAGAQDFFRRPSPLAGKTMLTLSLFEEVRTELKTTADENTKLDDLVGKLAGDFQAAAQNSGGDFTAIQAALDKLNEKYDGECAKALTMDQATRLRQLYIQFNGAATITDESISKDLAITDDEKVKIKKLRADQSQKILDAFQSAGGDMAAVGTALKTIHDEYNASLEKVLTEDQRAKLKTLEGAKFEFKKS